MSMTLAMPMLQDDASPFSLDDDEHYRRWRDAKLAQRARSTAELIVEVRDPLALSAAEREALLQRCARWNMAVYRTPGGCDDKSAARAVGRQLGLERLDANWLADEDGLSSITVGGGGAAAAADRAGYIPYTQHALKWHTDGYYHPQERRIRAMTLHCARPAAHGGDNRLLDHELAYIALRDAQPEGLRALMAADAMTIPAREDADGGVRAAQSGPVFSVDVDDGALHMRYTARTRSIAWRTDAATRSAVAFLERFLADDNPFALRLRLEPGMGIVANNVLHDRSAFVDDPARPRLVWRARYLDRVATPRSERAGAAWRNG